MYWILLVFLKIHILLAFYYGKGQSFTIKLNRVFRTFSYILSRPDEGKFQSDVSWGIDETPKNEKVDLNSLKMLELKFRLVDAGLSSNGRKQELIDRLNQYYSMKGTDNTKATIITSDVSRLTKLELQDRVAALGLPLSGTKQQLIERLNQHNAQNNNGEGTAFQEENSRASKASLQQTNEHLDADASLIKDKQKVSRILNLPATRLSKQLATRSSKTSQFDGAKMGPVISCTVEAEADHVSYMLGKGKTYLTELQRITGCDIQVPADRTQRFANANVTIIGTQKEVKYARDTLLRLFSDLKEGRKPAKLQRKRP